VYEDIYDAKTAVEHLSGFNVANRYLIVLYYNHNKHSKKVSSCAHEWTTLLTERVWMSACWLVAHVLFAEQALLVSDLLQSPVH